MSGPSVTVQRAPDGWTHIGGPGMHLLIALDEDDERTLTASDAADGGDLDDVIDVLTTGGMRQAHHFVGVHWEPRTRIVAHGPVAARVVLADGSAREVRPASPRVWTDIELDEHPESVDLRVLDDNERTALPDVPLLLTAPTPTSSDRPVPPVPAAPASSDRPAPPVPTAPASSDRPAPPVPAAPGSSERPAPPASAAPGSSDRPAPAHPAETRPVPTFGAPPASASTSAATPARAQDWRRPESTPESQNAPAPNWSTSERTVDPPTTRPSLPAWGSGAPRAARRTPAPTTGRAGHEPVASAADDPARAGGNQPTQTSPAAYRKDVREAQRDVHSTWAARPAPAEEQAEEGPATPSYDYLFGGTMTAEEHRRLLAEAGRDEPADDDADSPEPIVTTAASGALPVVPPPPPAQTPAAPAPAPQPVPAGGLISSVPWATTATTSEPEPEADAAPAFTGRHSPPPAPTLIRPAAPPEPQPSSPVEAAPHTIAAEPDDAELTVDRSALLAARNAALEGDTGPRVMAVLCTAGHSSPPHANRCRVCAQPIPPQEPFEMPRPALGTLRLSTGDVVTLDRDVLLGRAPKPVDGLAPEEQPHVVKVPSPERDISRNHVEVLIEGWHVLIRDLGTTNGTTVALPGEAPVRLRANDQQSLEPGSVVSMADEVSFTFEVGS